MPLLVLLLDGLQLSRSVPISRVGLFGERRKPKGLLLGERFGPSFGDRPPPPSASLSSSVDQPTGEVDS